jgi:hypothetical protein
MTNPSPTTPTTAPVDVGDQPAPKDAAMDRAIEAAADAMCRVWHGPQWDGLTDLYSAHEGLAAAVPYIERAIRDKIAAAEALHAPKRLHPEFRLRPWCEECSTGERTFHDDGVFTHRVYWPCRTAQALGMVDPLDPARVARGGEATK